jgi:beta-glucosidase
MDWADDVAGIVQLWYPGQEGGAALAEVLFGDADPGGRLPTSFPRRIEDTPAFAHYPGSDGRARYGEGLFVGYRHYDTHDVRPRFCFGYGLSYTEFAYGPLQVDVIPGRREPRDGRSDPVDGPSLVRLHVDVTNVGVRSGSEVVQVYVRDVTASVLRPSQELKQFCKLRLAPGETRTVHLELPRRAFAYWDVAHHDWVVEPGEFEIRVGSSSRHIHHTATVDLR